MTSRIAALIGAGLAVLLCLSAGVLAVSAQSPDAAAACCPDERLIHTSGTGEVSATPDQAVISVSTVTEDPDPVAAQAKNSERMNAVIAALKSAGVAEKDLATTGYTITPVYEETGGVFTQKVKTYRVTNTLAITVHDVDQAGSLLDTAVSSGADTVNGISFTLSDQLQDSLRSGVLTLAMQQARTDADTVAAAAGLKVSGVKEVSVGGLYVPSPTPYYSYADSAKVAATPVQPGEMKVTASVSVTYLCT